MYISTGSPRLDKATLDALRLWRFRPGATKGAKVPITYSMEGSVKYEATRKSMDDALARYLGKGTVLKGPIPEFPIWRTWTDKEGRGVYEMHVNKAGLVERVVILKSSGDPVFDQAAQKTLGKWLLSRGPLVIELPLRFVLTPESYSVDVAR